MKRARYKSLQTQIDYSGGWARHAWAQTTVHMWRDNGASSKLQHCATYRKTLARNISQQYTASHEFKPLYTCDKTIFKTEVTVGPTNIHLQGASHRQHWATYRQLKQCDNPLINVFKNVVNERTVFMKNILSCAQDVIIITELMKGKNLWTVINSVLIQLPTN